MSDIVEGCAAAWNRMAMERELAEASKKLVAQSTEITRLRAALRRWEQTGCPNCNGDCCAANIPMPGCIMREARAALGGSDD